MRPEQTSGWDRFHKSFMEYVYDEIENLQNFVSTVTPSIKIQLNEDYPFTGRKANWLGAYERRRFSLAKTGILSIAVNEIKIFDELSKRNALDDFNIEAQARITVGHEVGHGLAEWLRLNTNKKITVSGEEYLVEEFGRSRFSEATGVYGSKLEDIFENSIKK